MLCTRGFESHPRRNRFFAIFLGTSYTPWLKLYFLQKKTCAGKRPLFPTKEICKRASFYLGAVKLVQALLELDEEERGEEHHHKALHRKAGHGDDED